MSKTGKKSEIGDKTCFVIMPFNPALDAVYENAIQAAIAAIPHLICRRADDIYGPRPIMADVWRSIQSADIIVADLTGRNPNVLYELGLAHAIQKPVVLIAQSMDDVPFDLRAIRCLTYSSDRESRELLRKKLASAVTEYLRDAANKSPELLSDYVVLEVSAQIAAQRAKSKAPTGSSDGPSIASGEPQEQLQALVALGKKAGGQYDYAAKPGDVAVVVQCLDSLHPEVRLAAIQCLGKLKSKAHAHLLHQLAEDPNPAIQEAAVRAIGDSYDRNAEELLLELWTKKPPLGVREALIETLGRIGTETSANSFGKILKNPAATDQQVRAAVKLLCRLEHVGGLVPVLEVELGRLDKATKLVLAEGLTELEWPRPSSHRKIEKVLLELLDDDDEDVRGAALAAWCMNSNEEDNGFLDRNKFWGRLLAESGEVVQAFLQAVALYRLPFSTSDGSRLMELQKRHPSTTEDVVMALGDKGGPECADFMLQFLDTGSDHRQSAFIYFARNPTAVVEAACRREMREGKANTPLLASICLARLGHKDAVDFVKEQVKGDMAYAWAKKYALPVLQAELGKANAPEKRSLNQLIKLIENEPG